MIVECDFSTIVAWTLKISFTAKLNGVRHIQLEEFWLK